MRVKVPSKQEYEIYHAVETMGQSQRATAERFGIPVAKVREIIDEVRAFIVQHGSLQFLNVPPDKLELVAIRIHVKRLMDFHRLMIRHIAKLEREAKVLAKKPLKAFLRTPCGVSLLTALPDDNNK